jgi:hypothetical protein
MPTRRRRAHPLAAALLLAVGPGAGAEPAPAGLAIVEVEVAEGALRVEIVNRGERASEPTDLVVATRAAGRLVGSSRHRVAPLGPGGIREERVVPEIWGAHRSDLRAGLERQDCCTTRVWLEPGGAPPLEIRHGLGPAVSAPPDASAVQGRDP